MPAPDSWSAAQYVRFEAERNRPIDDLLAAIPLDRAERVADLGCGPGNSTQRLMLRFPGAQAVGIDSSADMLAAARKRLPDVRFDQADIATWQGEARFDVILANAALQWVPNHETLLPRLVNRLMPGGCLAVQMPDNLGEPAHRLMRTLAASGAWAAKLANAAASRTPRHTAEWYYGLLRNHGRVDVWRTVYHHPLANAAAVTEWFKGSGLRPFLDPLSDDERQMFLARYTEAVAGAYPAFDDGSVLLPFPRLFFTVTLSPQM